MFCQCVSSSSFLTLENLFGQPPKAPVKLLSWPKTFGVILVVHVAVQDRPGRKPTVDADATCPKSSKPSSGITAMEAMEANAIPDVDGLHHA